MSSNCCWSKKLKGLLFRTVSIHLQKQLFRFVTMHVFDKTDGQNSHSKTAHCIKCSCTVKTLVIMYVRMHFMIFLFHCMHQVGCSREVHWSFKSCWQLSISNFWAARRWPIRLRHISKRDLKLSWLQQMSLKKLFGFQDNAFIIPHFTNAT